MALSPEEILRIRNRARLYTQAQQALANRPVQQQPVVVSPEQRVQPERNWAKRLGMGALRFLDQSAAIGGGTLRRGIQALQPGEQRLEAELRNIREQQGPDQGFGQTLQRYGQASRLDPGMKLFDTPFGFAEKGSKFNPLPFTYLPQEVTSRGVAEVAGDPLNVAMLVPFVGAPLRAAESAVIGAAKGAVSGTLGSVGRGLAAGGGTRTVGGVLSGVAQAPIRGVVRAGEEAARSATRAVQLEKQLGRGIVSRATPKGAKADIPTVDPGPRHEVQQVTRARTGVSDLDNPKTNSDVIEETANNITTPVDEFSQTRGGKYVTGNYAPGFKETFGKSKLWTSFTERTSGLKGVANLEGNSPLGKIARIINKHNKAVTQGNQAQDLINIAVRNLEREMGTDAFTFTDQGFISNVFKDANGNVMAWDALSPNQKKQTHSLKVFEEIAKDYDYKLKRVDNRNADGGYTYKIKTDKKLKQTITLNRRQVMLAEGVLDNLNEMGKHAYKKEINEGIRTGTLTLKNIDPIDLKGQTDPDEILREIAIAHGVKFGKKKGKGGYVAHIWKLGEDVEDFADWEAAYGLKFTRTRAGLREKIEKSRKYSTDELVNDLLSGEAERLGRRVLFTPADMVSNYGKMATRKAARDDLEIELRKVWKDRAEAVYKENADVYLSKATWINKKASGKSYTKEEAKKIIDEHFESYKNNVGDDLEELVDLDEVIGKDNPFDDEFNAAIKDIQNRDPSLTELESTALAFKYVSPEIGKRLSRHVGIREKGGVSGFSKWVNNEIFGPLRGLRAGIDFGFMGINTLPLLFVRPQAYAQAWKRAIASLKEENYQAFVAKNLDKYIDMTEMGITLSGHSTDIFDALQSPSGTLGIAGRTPLVGKFAERQLSRVQSPLERSFYASLDSARLSMYDMYSPLWRDLSGAERVAMRNSMSDFINYSTGGFNSVQEGITPTQRDIESGWIFFSPRYTRASLALVGKAFSGDLAGVETRRLINNALTVAIPMYIHTAKALEQEPNLDPTSGQFLTVNINGDNIGPATFFRQLATLSARLIEDPEAVAFIDDRPGLTFKDKVFNHPIIKFFRGRTPLGTGLAVDIATGSDYMGNDIEGAVDWSKHLGVMSLPFWAESAFFGDPRNAGPAAIVSEVLGSRSFPDSYYNERKDLRDQKAEEIYGTEWNLLNDNERTFIETQTDASQKLASLSDEIKILRKDKDQGFDRLMEQRRLFDEQLQQDFDAAVMPILTSIVNGESRWTLKDLTERAKEANRVKRVKREQRKETGADDEVNDYFDKLKEDGSIATQHSDVKMQEYMNDVVQGSIRGDGSVDYGLRDRLETNFFQSNPGMEEYIDTNNYYSSLSKDTPALLLEYYQGLQEYRYYWENSEQVVLDSRPEFQNVVPMYQEYQDAPFYEQKVLREENPTLDNFLKSMSAVRKAMRKQDKILDRFLVRWGVGGVTTPQHPENKILHDDDVKKGDSRFRLYNYDIKREDLL